MSPVVTFILSDDHPHINSANIGVASPNESEWTEIATKVMCALMGMAYVEAFKSSVSPIRAFALAEL